MTQDSTGYTLLDAVDELTQTTKRRERQDVVTNGHVTGQTTIVITHQPLLTQLAAAIAGTIGSDAGSKNLSSERSVLDADALFKFIKIDAAIRDWCRGQKLVPGKDPAENLRAWYVAQLAHPHPDEVDAFHVRTLTGWAGMIRAKLDPWREKDLPDDCPACGAKTWWREGAEYYRPLIIKYKPIGPDTIQEARALCRACETVWHVRELAWALEQRNQEQEAS